MVQWTLLSEKPCSNYGIRPQTCNGDIKQFLSTQIISTTVTHWPVWSTTVTSMSHNKWSRPISE